MDNIEAIKEKGKELLGLQEKLKKLKEERMDAINETKEKVEKLKDEIMNLWPDAKQKSISGKGVTVTRAIRRKAEFKETEKGWLKGIRGLEKLAKEADVSLDNREVSISLDEKVLDRGTTSIEEIAGIRVRRGGSR